MYNAGKTRKHIHVVYDHDDIPESAVGSLIPSAYTKKANDATGQTAVIAATAQVERQAVYQRSLVLALAGLLIGLLVFGSGRYVFALTDTLFAAPVVVVESVALPEPLPLHYGVQPLLSYENFFSETKTRFLADKLTFIEADLSTMVLRYYEAGEELFQAPILAKGKAGSWWETPAGLYEVEQKHETHTFSFSNTELPWNLVFQGNFFIHGWPKALGGTPVVSEYSGGCIRLSDEDAEQLYRLVKIDTPVLVHEEAFAGDGFVYEPKGPTLTADEYLVADIHNNAILVSSDLDAVVPIASITKLMTALVAAEHINLDTDVSVSQEKYVTTLIPRLGGRWQASMYSLLQLLLVESSNEAAEVIAAQVGREQFIDRMNEKALALGLDHTTFTDPSGLDDGNVSTMSDLLRLVQYLHFNRSFILELTHDQSLPTAYTSGEFGELTNFNIVEDDDTFIGGKIGETHAAGQTSVTLHKLNIDGVERVVAFILLGSEARNDDVHVLLNYVTEQFTETEHAVDY